MAARVSEGTIPQWVLVLEIAEAEEQVKEALRQFHQVGEGVAVLLVEVVNLAFEEVVVVVVLTCFSASPRFHPFAGGRKMT